MYYVLFNFGTYFTGCFSQDTNLIGSVILDTIPPMDDPDKICCYRYNGLGYELDNVKYQAVLDAKNVESVLEQVTKLKHQLSESDYKVIKCYEAQLTSEPLPYDITPLITDRQRIRDEINILESLNL